MTHKTSSLLTRAVPLTAVALFAMAAPALASQWSDSHGHGRASVTGDRNTITVCDDRDDREVYRVIWHNDNPVDARSPFRLTAPPSGGCASDSSILGKVMVYKLCYGTRDGSGRISWSGCRTPVWVR
jgi:hypothetical protein